MSRKIFSTKNYTFYYQGSPRLERKIEEMIFIYALINPLTNKIFYIGASKHPHIRAAQHISESKTIKNDKAKVIDEILHDNKKPQLLILEHCEPTLASSRENFYIDLFKKSGHDLKQIQKSSYSKTHEVRTTSFLERWRWSK